MQTTSASVHRPRLTVILFFITCLGVGIPFSLSCSGKQEGRAMLPIGNVDMPRSGETVKATLSTGGWALSEEGISEVSVYIDRTFVASTPLGVSRPDVLKAFPHFTNIKDPGWNVAVGLSKVSAGPHEVVIQARSNQGAMRDIGFLQINVAQ